MNAIFSHRIAIVGVVRACKAVNQTAPTPPPACVCVCVCCRLSSVFSAQVFCFSRQHSPMACKLIFFAFFLLVHATLVVCDSGAFPPHTNAVSLAPVSASRTCGLQSPTDYCVTALVQNGISTSLKCIGSYTCANTSACPYPAPFPAMVDLLAASTAQGNVCCVLGVSHPFSCVSVFFLHSFSTCLCTEALHCA